jgi:chlorite dismutase
MKPLLVRFAGGATGQWRIDRLDAVLGDPLPPAARLAVLDDPDASPREASSWVLRGVTSNERYANQTERAALLMRQQGLGRKEATCAALIPIRKSETWWELTQDERREIFEERSRHIATGLHYLPAVARRLHHGRDLGEPFDFLTWFEYAPDHAEAFEELVVRLRQTAEWSYVEREVDIRLVREPEPQLSRH